jgi:hypothetical protein
MSAAAARMSACATAVARQLLSQRYRCEICTKNGFGCGI